jgi:hypothetical protein
LQSPRTSYGCAYELVARFGVTALGGHIGRSSGPTGSAAQVNAPDRANDTLQAAEPAEQFGASNLRGKSRS